jgi:hypothetical protein
MRVNTYIYTEKTKKKTESYTQLQSISKENTSNCCFYNWNSIPDFRNLVGTKLL